MDIAYLEVEIILPDCHSLKEKRGVIKSIKERIKNKFNVSIAEIKYQNLWGRAVLGLVTISNDKKENDMRFSKIENFINENLKSGYIANLTLEHI